MIGLLADPKQTPLAAYCNLMESTLLYYFRALLFSRDKEPVAWQDICRWGFPKKQRCCKWRSLTVPSEVGCV